MKNLIITLKLWDDNFNEYNERVLNFNVNDLKDEITIPLCRSLLCTKDGNRPIDMINLQYLDQEENTDPKRQ